MSFASDLESVTAGESAQAIDGRTRIQTIYYVSTGDVGYIHLHDGTDDSEDPVVTIATPPLIGATSMMLPNAGVLFKQGVYVDMDNVTSVTLFFYGGAPA